MQPLRKLTRRAVPGSALKRPIPLVRCLNSRPFHLSARLLQQQQQQQHLQEHSDPQAHRNFYRTHGRALFKALTLAFFTYQVVYWSWLVLETEEIKGQKNREIQSLESEVRLLDEQRKGDGTAANSDNVEAGKGSIGGRKRLLQEK